MYVCSQNSSRCTEGIRLTTLEFLHRSHLLRCHLRRIEGQPLHLLPTSDLRLIYHPLTHHCLQLRLRLCLQALPGLQVHTQIEINKMSIIGIISNY